MSSSLFPLFPSHTYRHTGTCTAPETSKSLNIDQGHAVPCYIVQCWCVVDHCRSLHHGSDCTYCISIFQCTSGHCRFFLSLYSRQKSCAPNSRYSFPHVIFFNAAHLDIFSLETVIWLESLLELQMQYLTTAQHWTKSIQGVVAGWSLYLNFKMMFTKLIKNYCSCTVEKTVLNCIWLLLLGSHWRHHPSSAPVWASNGVTSFSSGSLSLVAVSF